MGQTPRAKLVVKHTFLEVEVDDTDAQTCNAGRRGRSFTDPPVSAGSPGGAFKVEYQPVSASEENRIEELAGTYRLPPVHSGVEGRSNASCTTPPTPTPFTAASNDSLPWVMEPKHQFMRSSSSTSQSSSSTAKGSGRTPVDFPSAAARGKQVVPAQSSPARGSTQSPQHKPGIISPAGGSGVPAFSPDESRTTLMLRNLPNNYTRQMLLELITWAGFLECCDFVYLPMDFKTGAGLGYAFVNLCRSSDVPHFWRCFQGFSQWSLPSEKVCSVSWSHPHQGYAKHVERYRNSPVMHRDVPEDWKPVLLQNGMQVQFPPPTKEIKAPKAQNCRNARNPAAGGSSTTSQQQRQ
mmetsp:Transcript_59925/g.111046  ORF Transcript_59925/g.111046 Transcript_59925/m.111046 type:complete len:351 (+) Transcript_59925:80-1132(+)